LADMALTLGDLNFLWSVSFLTANEEDGCSL